MVGKVPPAGCMDAGSAGWVPDRARVAPSTAAATPASKTTIRRLRFIGLAGAKGILLHVPGERVGGVQCEGRLAVRVDAVVEGPVPSHGLVIGHAPVDSVAPSPVGGRNDPRRAVGIGEPQELRIV